MRMRAGLASAAIAIFIAARIGAAGQAGQAGRPQATFRAEINYVEVDVLVTDAQGNFVPGLTAADFELVDAGKPQKIEVFHEIDVPIEHADRPILTSNATVYPDVVSNAAAREGRVYVILLDDLHTSPVNTPLVKMRAREFIEKYLASNDVAAVLHTSGRRDVSQDFTSNRDLLLKAVDGFMGRRVNSALENKIDDFQARMGSSTGMPPTPFGLDRDSAERRAAVRRTYLAIRDVSNHMATVSGRRKAMLFFSEGIDLEGDSLPAAESTGAADGQTARGEMVEAIAAATRANVHIYPIDAWGMSSNGVDASKQALPRGEQAEALGLTSEALAAIRKNAQGSLRVLAEQTGGIATVDSNRFDANFARIQRENSTYYLLGYYPTTERDGKYHRIQVKATRPGLTVRSRAGYHATRPDTTKPAAPAGRVDDLLTAAVASPGLPMSVSLPAFRHTAEKSRVLMAVDMPRDVFRFETAGAVSSEDLEIVYQVIDQNAKIVESSAQAVELRLRADTRALVEQRGFRAVFPIDLAPGRYQVRIAATTKNAARRGSVFADLVIPDFFKEDLIWSGVSLTSAAALEVPTRPGEGLSQDIVPIMPAAVRTFPAGDTLALYAEAYDNDTRAPHDVELTAVIRDDTGKVVFTTTEARSSAELGGKRGGYGLRTDIPLAGLPPGSYVLTLTARSRASGNATASRDIPFAIS